ncbi:MAG TPA: glycoside hydrolase family 47 protein, partial [Saprospiraceae bacterium]|nr:glycoside hydrolase family 47 protein [Saprospiraceae bacterium]
MGNIIFNTKFTLLLKIIFFLLSISVIYSCKITLKGSKPISLPSNNIKTDSMAADVKAQMLHCWNTYKKYAWGHDEVRPLAMSSKNY